MSLLAFPPLENFSPNLESQGQTDSVTETDGSPKVHLLSGWRTNKNFPEDLELQNLLEKLSDQSLDKQDTDSLSSHTSGL